MAVAAATPSVKWGVTAQTGVLTDVLLLIRVIAHALQFDLLFFALPR